MKTIDYIILIFLFVSIQISAEDFVYVNTDGIKLNFRTISADDVALLYNTADGNAPGEQTPNYPNLHIDTLNIPEKVVYDNHEYKVTSIESLACGFLEDIKVVSIPASVAKIYNREGWWNNAFTWNKLQAIKVHPQNPNFCDKEGVLYTKDKKRLIAYPTSNSKDTFIIDEGVEELASTSFFVVDYIKYLELPLSLRKICRNAIGSDIIKHVVVKDNVDTLSTGAIYSWGLSHLTLGKGLKYVGNDFVDTDSILDIYCRAETPPAFMGGDHLSTNVLENGTLHVPLQSVQRYRETQGWSQFAHISPIEPPIVVGKDEAEVSWVQNFSATGYVWTLYTDEAKTKRFMSLTFDANGHLTRIDINSNSAPERMMPLDDEEEKRFAEYYSFTITGLSPQTQYFYTRQSLKGTEVIDEETGSFTTDSPSNLHDINANGLTNKILHEGHLLINHNGHLHTATGARVK